MTTRIGYYVHHHGRGHVQRAGCILPHLESDVTVFTSAEPSPALTAHADVIRLPLDTDLADSPAARDVPNAVVLPNPAVEWLATERPTTLEQLSACEDIGPKRIERYGEAILAALASTSKDPAA